VRSDCGQTTGGLSNNMAISQDIGGTTRKLAFVNNLFLSKPDNANKSIGFNMSACGPAAVFRDNFFSGWDTVINLNNCATHPLVQWNAFSGNDLVSSSPSLTEAQLAADADGKVGNRTADNKYNFVAACTYDADGTGGAGSPCLDKGSIGATVPDTTTMVQTATSVNAHFGKDALGQVRPKDLSSVTNATGGDGTDIGPVERQQ
jgi:hypothetical protein